MSYSYDQTNLRSMNESRPVGANDANTADDALRETRLCLKNFATVEHDRETGEHMFSIGATADRPTTPVAGQPHINTETARIDFYDGSSWVSLFMASNLNILDNPVEIKVIPKIIYLSGYGNTLLYHYSGTIFGSGGWETVGNYGIAGAKAIMVNIFANHIGLRPSGCRIMIRSLGTDYGTEEDKYQQLQTDDASAMEWPHNQSNINGKLIIPIASEPIIQVKAIDRSDNSAIPILLRMYLQAYWV